MRYSAPLKLCALLCLSLTVASSDSVTKVHVIFSNHLDVGFNAQQPGVPGSDDAAINLYFDRHFPKAIEIANAFRQQNSTRNYTWMTHAWLLSLFFDCPTGMNLHCPSPEAKKDVEAAIRRGDIHWHALPFNAQLEFSDASLLEYAAFLVHRLDDQFGLPHKKVVSLRDVPGFTRSAIPILRSQGVTAFSQGVNAASAPPGVPKNSLHYWKDPVSNTQLLHWVHQGGYSGFPQDDASDCIRLPTFGEVLCHAWKQDNEGPHTVEEAMRIYNYYEDSFPGATIMASTFNDYLTEVEKVLQHVDLPTYSGEIGDTWVYGVPTDSHKVSRFMAALRLRTAMSWRYDDYAFHNFSRLLMKVTEHTWGVDVKMTINDWSNWSNEKFEAKLRSKASNFVDAVHSWQRQAKYVDWALEALGLSPEILDAHLATHPPADPEQDGFVEAELGTVYTAGAWEFAIDPKTGGLSKLRRRWGNGEKGIEWASADHPLGQMSYDTFTEADFDVIYDHYTFLPNAREWAHYDFGKKNCSLAKPKHASISPSVTKAWVRQTEGAEDVLIRSELPHWMWREAGAPKEVWTRVRSGIDDEALRIDVSLKLKTATRLPEAAWVKFRPDVEAADPTSWRMFKLGEPVSPLDVMVNGSQSQHGISTEGMTVESSGDGDTKEVLNIRSLDACIVSPGVPTPFPIGFYKPDMKHGISVNLLNNIWGTNYAQWQPYDANGLNMTYRFVLTAERSRKPHAVEEA